MDETRGLADLIRSHRPAGSRAYYLQNSNGRFPVSGGYSLEPFKPPVCPAGSYSVCFLEDTSSNRALSPAVAGFGFPIIPVPACDGSVENTALAKKETATVGTAAKQPDPLLTHPDHIKNRVEFEQIRMADETVRSKLHMTDLGQSLLYAQAWRKEAQAAMQSQAEMAARERERAERDRQTAEAESQRLSKLVQEERMQRPHAPPDHFATSLAFLGQLAGLAGSALSPAIAKQHGGKIDPVIDALIGSPGEAERTPTDNAALQATKKELETARSELATKKAAAAAAAAAPTAAAPTAGALATSAPSETKQSADIVERALTLLERMEQRIANLEKRAGSGSEDPEKRKKKTSSAAPARSLGSQSPKKVKKKSAKGAKR